jgi:hypothetical protein
VTPHHSCRFLLTLIVMAALSQSSVVDAAEASQQSVILVVGAGGSEEFAATFKETAEKWLAVSAKTNATVQTIGLEKADQSDLERFGEILKKEDEQGDTLWIVLIGHGTFDGKLAKFNLRGPDLAAAALATKLERFKRPLVVINGASSSAPFINRISGPGRVVVTATDSGYELNYARFGIHLAEAMLANDVDLDKDDQTSILEAFLAASQKTVAFYENDGRLVTEHALIDDNGDARGTPRTFFRGVRVERSAAGTFGGGDDKKERQPDGLRANQIQLIRSPSELALTPEQRRQRGELEKEIEALRAKKRLMIENDYYAELERLFLAIANVLEDE